MQAGRAEMLGTITQAGDAVTITGTFTSSFSVATADGWVHCPTSGTWEVTRTG